MKERFTPIVRRRRTPPNFWSDASINFVARRAAPDDAADVQSFDGGRGDRALRHSLGRLGEFFESARQRRNAAAAVDVFHRPERRAGVAASDAKTFTRRADVAPSADFTALTAKSRNIEHAHRRRTGEADHCERSATPPPLARRGRPTHPAEFRRLAATPTAEYE